MADRVSCSAACGVFLVWGSNPSLLHGRQILSLSHQESPSIRQLYKCYNYLYLIMVLEKTLESPLDNKEIIPVNPKGNQPWIFIGRTDVEDEMPILWPPDAKSFNLFWLIGKDPDAGKDWRKEKGVTEDKLVGWHHQLNGHEFEQTLGDDEGQGSLACCSPWCRKESDTTEQFNISNNKGGLTIKFIFYYKTCLLITNNFNGVPVFEVVIPSIKAD